MSDGHEPLPTAGVLFSIQIALASIRQNRTEDAELVLRELARELIDDCVAECAGEAQYSSFQ